MWELNCFLLYLNQAAIVKRYLTEVPNLITILVHKEAFWANWNCFQLYTFFILAPTHQISWCHHAFQRRLIYFSRVCIYIQRTYIVSEFKISNTLLTSILLECWSLTAQFPAWHVRLKPITFQITSFQRIIFKTSVSLEIVHCLKACLASPHLNKKSLYSPVLIIRGIQVWVNQSL